ncbi:BON domain-containing protein [Burkholderia sp. PAMC 26561]|uniref:BON domain-containing protein n=1 Tax=Burkholderia sp. PAMC 26561 TaxID=1795043 RepID=UPI00076B4346|nr:BON domain-containing protein [Burkholderia sp. PAMC 26561]AME26910.2 hypothetical protein AXG89_23295 [Burkholderia sp. PAMC 26561]AME27944.2 hypothetical protein AXG89_29385 [Burkholderia sp. PAMC 26561]
MKTTFSHRATVLATATLIGIGAMSTAGVSFAQQSAFARKTAVIKADFKLEEAVQKAFDNEKNFDSSDVRVVSRKGIVTLDGNAPDDGQIKKATEIAAATPGVKSVTNSLTAKEAGH